MPNGRHIDTLRYGSGHWHGTLWQGRTLVDLERDHLHRETVRELGSASGSERLTERRSYDPQSRLSGFILEQGGKRLRERRYEYDLAGNLTHIDDSVRGSIRYTYDPLGQLLSAVQPGLTETFAFDPAGNLLDPDTSSAPIDTRKVLRELDEQPSPGASTHPVRLAKVTHNLLRQYMGYAYEYDAQGNTVVKRPRVSTVANEEGVLTFAYDAENRMTTAVRTFATSRIVARYSYDAFGRRIAKRVDEQRWAEGETPPSVGQAHTGVLTLFVWDGDVMVQEVHADKTVTYVYEPDSFVPLARVESAEPVRNDVTLIASITPALNNQFSPAKIDLDRQVKALSPQLSEKSQQCYRTNCLERSVKAKLVNDEILYFRCDHLGTPLELIDRDGIVVWAVRYHGWGQLLWQSQRGFLQPLRFQGQYHDAETNLFYNRFRFYDPDVARYLSQDPIGLVGGINLYRYNPNPVGWVDPLGLAPCGPRINLKHIFHGETNKKGKPTGFHHQGSIGHGKGAVIEQRGPSNAQGVYAAIVGVLNPATGVYQTKKSTMFPDSWSRAKTLDEIRSAYRDAVSKGNISGNKFKGVSCAGVAIEGYLDNAGNINTAYPKM